MNTLDSDEPHLLAAARPMVRRLLTVLATLTTQYMIIAIVVSLTVAGILHYRVTPKVVGQFEAIEAALKRLPTP